MANISPAHLEIRLSGGAANTDPDLSLGGDMSSERVLAQSTTALTNVTGVTIDFAAGNPTGAGTLSYVQSTTSLTWQPFGLAVGAAVNVSGGGRFTIYGETGMLHVTVVPGSLPGTNQNDSVTIANIANEEFDNVTRQQSFTGLIEHRCFYLYNAFKQNNISSITRSGATATVETSTAHGYTTGDEITIVGAVESEYNGTFEITVTDSDTFTYTVSGTPATPATGTLAHGKKFLSVGLYIAAQPSPGLIEIGADPVGVGDGVTRSVSTITRSGSVAHATTGANHGYEDGQTVKIAGAAQAEYNGNQVIDVIDPDEFEFAVAGSPVTPATGTITVSRGVAATVINETAAPSGVTFSDPDNVAEAIDLGALRPGEAVAFWMRRTIDARNTTTNTAALFNIVVTTYF